MTLSLVFYIFAAIILSAACINAACCLYKDINNTTINTSNKILAIIGDMFLSLPALYFMFLRCLKLLVSFHEKEESPG